MKMQTHAAVSADILTYLTTAAESPLHGVPVDDTRVLTGDENALWRIGAADQQLVLKMFLDAGQARGRRQFNMQRRAAQLGLAPEPVAFDRHPVGLSHQILIYQWQAGKRFDAAEETHRAALSAALAHLHAQAPQGDERLSPLPLNLEYQWNLIQGSMRQLRGWLEGQAPDALTVALGYILGAAERQIPADQKAMGNAAALGLVHGDLYPEHCLVQAGRMAFVDWEMGGLGDPAREIAHLSIHVLRGLSPADRAYWMEDYLARMAQDALRDRIRMYEKLLPLAGLLDLGLYMVRTPSAQTEDDAGARFLLHLAFRESLMDVTRVLRLDHEPEEIESLSHLYRDRLPFADPIHAGA